MLISRPMTPSTLMPTKPPTPTTLRRRVVKILGDEPSWYEGYSGRGMFGRQSTVAFTTPVSPGSTEGKKLLKSFAVDNMGRDYIYYTR